MKYSLAILFIATSLLAAGCNKGETTAEQTNQPETTTEAVVGNEQNPATAIVTTPPTTKPKTAPTPAPTVKSYTMAEVNQANSKSKCWTVINGSVYDLTSVIAMHPGGASKILPLCGTDGTTAFNNQHATQSSPLKMLAKLKLGLLTSS